MKNYILPFIFLFFSCTLENKNFDNLNDEELSELKDSLEETIQDRKRKRQAASKKAMGTKGIATAWIIIAIIISIYRYISL